MRRAPRKASAANDFPESERSPVPGHSPANAAQEDPRCYQKCVASNAGMGCLRW